MLVFGGRRIVRQFLHVCVSMWTSLIHDCISSTLLHILSGFSSANRWRSAHQAHVLPRGAHTPCHPQISCFWDDISINASPSLLQIPAQACMELGSPLVTPDGLASVPHQVLATHPWREHNGMQPAGRHGQVQIILLIMQNGEQASQNKDGLVVQWRENILPSFSVSLCLPHSN